jgi:hypothetical protein
MLRERRCALVERLLAGTRLEHRSSIAPSPLAGESWDGIGALFVPGGMDYGLGVGRSPAALRVYDPLP